MCFYDYPRNHEDYELEREYEEYLEREYEEYLERESENWAYDNVILPKYFSCLEYEEMTNDEM